MIQTAFRRHFWSRKFVVRQRAANVIQPHVRGWLARNQLQMEADAVDREMLAQASATAIQSVWRGHRDRSSFVESLGDTVMEIEKESARAARAAAQIQARLRGARDRSTIANLSNATILIQARTRGLLVRNAVADATGNLVSDGVGPTG